MRHRIAFGLTMVTAALLSACADEPRATLGPQPPPAIAAPLLGVTTPPDSDARYVVMLKNDVPNAGARAAALAAQLGKTTLFLYEHGMKGFAAILSPSAVRTLQSTSDVKYVELDRMAYYDGTDNNPG